jgi:folate-binding protein YgfZ
MEAPRSSPLSPAHRAAGAVMGEADSWETPLRFGDPAAEHAAARHGAALADRSRAGRLRLTGSKRLDLLHRIATQDLRGLAPGQGAIAAMLTDKGRILDALRLHAREDDVVLVTSPGQAPAIQKQIESLRFRDDVQVSDITGTTAMLELAGPAAPALLEGLAGESGLADLPRYHSRRVRLAGHEALAARTLGMGAGFRLIVDAAAAEEVWLALTQGPRPARAVPMGEEAWESLRIERGVPRHGRELTLDHNPLEARLDASISWTKGCYIGQEVVARLDSRQKVSRLLCGLWLDPSGAPLPAAGEELTAEDAPAVEAGRITSAVLSIAFARPIALAYVRQDLATPGARLRRPAVGAPPPGAVVAALPFEAASE